MKNINELPLSSAEMVYMAANTPSFIVRRLREDAVVSRLASEHSAADLKEKIEELLGIAPTDARGRVLPFVLLVALSLKHDLKSLQALKNIDSSNYRWFNLVLNALIEKHVPTQAVKIDYKNINMMSNFVASPISSSNINILQIGSLQ